MGDHVFTVRRVTGGAFGSEPGPARFLDVPPHARVPLPEHQVRKSAWMSDVMDDATGSMTLQSRQRGGDLVSFVPGYNHAPETMLQRLRHL